MRNRRITGPESVAGTYILQTINGEALPFTAQGDVVSAGSIQLNSAGTYTLSVTIDVQRNANSHKGLYRILRYGPRRISAS